MINFITGEKFIRLADFVFAPNNRKDCNKVKNTFNLDKVFDKAIVYTHTMYIRELFNLLVKIPKIRVIVISHNSDTNIDKTFIIPKNIEKWFAMNVMQGDEKIESIPIGLENEKWFSLINKKAIMMKQLSKPKRIRNLVYVNFDLKTNLEREEIYNYFEKQCSCWVTTEQGKNGYDFGKYINNIYNHKFVVCPEGNGIDTVRLWETLYMGSTPIVKWRSSLSRFLDLPILFVDKWRQVTDSFLIYYLSKRKFRRYSLDKLDFKYWENKIKNYEWKN